MKTRKTMFVSLLVLVTLVISAAVAEAAVQRWFGYVPGLGLIRNGELRVLSEPISMTQAGITLKVDQVILSSEKTVVTYSLEGITADLHAPPVGCRGENSNPVLRLSDGRSLELIGLVISDAYEIEATFAPAPADVMDAALYINRIDCASVEQAPLQWEVPLQFAAASQSLTAAPVYDASTTAGLPAVPSAASPSTLTAQPQGGLMLGTVIPIQGGYILSGTFYVVPPSGYRVVENYGGYLDDVTLTDAGGQALAVESAPDDFLNSTLPPALPENTFFWSCQVQGDHIRWPLTMTVHSLKARGPLLPPSELQLDVGPDPRADQTWRLNRDVPVGTKTAHIVSVRRINGEHELSGYEFTLVSDPLLDLSLEIKGHQRMGGGGGSNADGTETRVLAYSEPLPAGRLTVVVSGSELIQLSGPWQATWQAPVGASGTPVP